MTITLYHVPRTISSPIVQLLLELNLVNNPVVVQEMQFADLKSPSHLSINPLGTSPALHDSELGVTMWESGAIIDYLLELYDTENRLHPPPPSPSTRSITGTTSHSTTPSDQPDLEEQILARAKYLQLKQFVIATVYPFVASWYIHSLKAPAEQDADYMESAKAKWRTVLAPVLVAWLGEGPYFLGPHISAVSFLIAKPLTNIHALGLLPEFPSLEAFWNLVANRPSYRPAYYGLAATAETTGSPPKQSVAVTPTSASATTTTTKTTTAVSLPLKRFTWRLRRPMVAPTNEMPRPIVVVSKEQDQPKDHIIIGVASKEQDQPKDRSVVSVVSKEEDQPKDRGINSAVSKEDDQPKERSIISVMDFI
jgi:glutathione S-transferase